MSDLKTSFYDIDKIVWAGDHDKETTCSVCGEMRRCAQLVENAAGRFEDVNHPDWFPNYDTIKRWYCYPCFNRLNQKNEDRRTKQAIKMALHALIDEEDWDSVIEFTLKMRKAVREQDE